MKEKTMLEQLILLSENSKLELHFESNKITLWNDNQAIVEVDKSELHVLIEAIQNIYSDELLFDAFSSEDSKLVGMSDSIEIIN